MFRMVTVKFGKEFERNVTVLIAKDFFAHIRPTPSRDEADRLIRQAAYAAAQNHNAHSDVDKAPIYLQHITFPQEKKAANQNNFRLYFLDRNRADKQVRFIRGKYDKHSVVADDFSVGDITQIPEEKQQIVETNFNIVQKETNKLILNEIKEGTFPSAVLSTDKISVDIVNGNKEQKHQFAKTLLQKHDSDKKGHEQQEFADIVLNHRKLFSADFTKAIAKQADLNEFLSSISRKQKGEQNSDIQRYLKTVHEEFSREAAQVSEETLRAPTEHTAKLDANLERTRIEDNINAYFELRDSTKRVIGSIIAAIYHIAKQSYVHLLTEKQDSLDSAIKSFNELFKDFSIHIDPDNLSLSSLNEAYLDQLALDLDKDPATLAQRVSTLLNNSYKPGLIKPLANALNQVNGKNKFFTGEIAEHTGLSYVKSHTFEFNPKVQENLDKYSECRHYLFGAKGRDDVASVYELGHNMLTSINVSAEKETLELIDKAHVRLEKHKTNLGAFEALARTVERQRLSIEELESDLDYASEAIQSSFDIPSYSSIQETVSNEGINSPRNQLKSLIEEIDSNKTRLTQVHAAIIDNIDVAEHNLDSIITSAKQSAIEPDISITNVTTHLAIKKSKQSFIYSEEIFSTSAVASITSKLLEEQEQSLRVLRESITERHREYAAKIQAVQFIKTIKDARTHLDAVDVTQYQLDTTQPPQALNPFDEDRSKSITTQADEAIQHYSEILQTLDAQAITTFSHNKADMLESANDALAARKDLYHDIEQTSNTLSGDIIEKKKDVLAAKKATFDKLQANVLANAILNLTFWDNQHNTARRGTLTELTDQDNNTYLVPNEIAALIDIVKQNPDIATDTVAARKFIREVKAYAVRNPSNNVARSFFVKIRNQLSLSHNEEGQVLEDIDLSKINNIKESINPIGVDDVPITVKAAPLGSQDIQRICSLESKPSTGFTRLKARWNNWKTAHPIAHKVLIGAAIGLVVAAATTAIVFSGGLAALGITAGGLIAAAGGGTAGTAIVAGATVAGAAVVTGIGAAIGAITGGIKNWWAKRKARKQRNTLNIEERPLLEEDDLHDSDLDRTPPPSRKRYSLGERVTTEQFEDFSQDSLYKFNQGGTQSNARMPAQNETTAYQSSVLKHNVSKMAEAEAVQINYERLAHEPVKQGKYTLNFFNSSQERVDPYEQAYQTLCTGYSEWDEKSKLQIVDKLNNLDGLQSEFYNSSDSKMLFEAAVLSAYGEMTQQNPSLFAGFMKLQDKSFLFKQPTQQWVDAIKSVMESKEFANFDYSKINAYGNKSCLLQTIESIINHNSASAQDNPLCLGTSSNSYSF